VPGTAVAFAASRGTGRAPAAVARQGAIGAGVPRNAQAPAPSSAAVAFVTTEHFTLQGARSATIAESIGRATMFLTSVSGGLVALGLVATATKVGTAFYAFGLVLLPTLTFVGLVTFQRAVQSGVEDYGYAVRIARLRAYYFDNAPEVTPYLASVPPNRRLAIQGLHKSGWPVFRTVAGMVGIISAGLAGSSVGLAVASSSLAAALSCGVALGLIVLTASMRYQSSVWDRAVQTALFEAQDLGSQSTETEAGKYPTNKPTAFPVGRRRSPRSSPRRTDAIQDQATAKEANKCAN
ncbi:MAG TPA: hypothetical protein VN786_11030, partial [Acidimicrobiales bacterium]|nr:hypothetical protein [Acidimicrobiales bacterium]